MQQVAMTTKEKMSLEKTYYLEHPLTYYAFNMRPNVDFINKGCDEYDITLIEITQNDKYFWSQNKDLSFKEITNDIGKYYYPLYFEKEVSEDRFNNEQWTNVMIFNSKFVHKNKDGKHYIHVLIVNNTCAELYLQILSELYDEVDLEYTKRVLQKCNKSLYDWLNIDYTIKKLIEIGKQEKIYLIPNKFNSSIVANRKDFIEIDTNADSIEVEISPQELAEASVNLNTITISGKDQQGAGKIIVYGIKNGERKYNIEIPLALTEIPLTKIHCDITNIELENLGSNTELEIITNGEITDAQVENNTIASAEIRDGKKIYIESLATGDTSITIKALQDGYRENALTIPLSVKIYTQLILNKGTIEIRLEHTDQIQVTTNAKDYSVETGQGTIASFEKDGYNINIKGAGIGSDTLTIKAQAEGQEEAIKQVSVKVLDKLPTPLELPIEPIEIIKGQSKELTIATEADDVEVIENNPTIATCTSHSNEKIVIKALTDEPAGEATFTIKATATGKKTTEQTLSVTTIPVETTLDIVPQEISVQEGSESEALQIATNAESVTHEVNNANATYNQDTKKITGVNFGNANITFKALAVGSEEEKQITIPVNITAVPTSLSASAQKCAVNKTLSFNVTTNAEFIEAVSENTDIATISVSGKTINVTPVKIGNARIEVSATAKNADKKTIYVDLQIVSGSKATLSSATKSISTNYTQASITIPVTTNAESITATCPANIGSVKVSGKNVIFTPKSLNDYTLFYDINANITNDFLNGFKFKKGSETIIAKNAVSGNITIKTKSTIYDENTLNIKVTLAGANKVGSSSLINNTTIQQSNIMFKETQQTGKKTYIINNIVSGITDTNTAGYILGTTDQNMLCSGTSFGQTNNGTKSPSVVLVKGFLGYIMIYGKNTNSCMQVILYNT